MAAFRRSQWLFPIATTAHNLEEAIWLPRFVAAHASELPWHVEPGQFRFGLVVLTVAAWIVTYFSWRRGRQTWWAYMLFGYIVAMLVNVFVPHIPAAIVFGGYAPGVVTAVVVNLPVMAFLVVRALRERYVSGSKAVVFAVAVPVSIALMIPLLFAAGSLS